MAFDAVTLPRVTSERAAARSGSHPSGFQPSAGSRTVNAPRVIITK